VTVVVDASTLVAYLIDGGPEGQWAEQVLARGDLVGPHLLHIEVADVLRRLEARGEIGPETASLSHEDLLALTIDLVPYAGIAGRTWQLRGNVSAYDATYVAIAEELGAPLATLDRRLAAAPGPACEFLTPPS
jgi:predicted nucleic acid-binding protein